jgi:predicted acyl esterase
MVANEVLRGRYRTSLERPQPITPNQTTEFKYSLHTQSYRFQKGHRIMVQVQSSWFPIIDRNPQTFVPNIFEAKASDYRPATVKVYRTPRFASHLVLPVMSDVRPVP